MKNWVLLILVLVTAAGCTVYSNTAPAQTFGSFGFEKLQKGPDYEVLGDVQGHECWEYGFFVFHFTWHSGLPYPASMPLDPAESLPHAHTLAHRQPYESVMGAYYNALEAFKTADLVLPLRTKVDINQKPGRTEICTTVSGKAIRLKV